MIDWLIEQKFHFFTLNFCRKRHASIMVGSKCFVLGGYTTNSQPTDSVEMINLSKIFSQEGLFPRENKFPPFWNIFFPPDVMYVGLKYQKERKKTCFWCPIFTPEILKNIHPCIFFTYFAGFVNPALFKMLQQAKVLFTQILLIIVYLA